MTRGVWQARHVLTWIRDNRGFLAELILVVIFAISLALIGMVTVRRQTAVFQGIRTTVIHVPGPDGATLVTFIRDGRAYGREFPNLGTAVAFAEALR